MVYKQCTGISNQVEKLEGAISGMVMQFTSAVTTIRQVGMPISHAIIMATLPPAHESKNIKFDQFVSCLSKNSARSFSVDL